MRKLPSLLASAAILAAVPAFAQEEQTITLEQVPAAALAAAQGAAEGVTFNAVAMDDDEGTETYELSGTMANGRAIEIDVLADGTLEEVEEQIEASELPAEVTAALEANLPGFQPSMIEKSTRPDDLVVYEFEGTHDGGEVDVEINADGSNYTIIDDAAG